MCGIFGCIEKSNAAHLKEIRSLARMAQERGRDASGVVALTGYTYHITKAHIPITELLKQVSIGEKFTAGHSRLSTNGQDLQPVVRDGMICLHNGIITNCDELWKTVTSERLHRIDTEIIIALVADGMRGGQTPTDAANYMLGMVEGVVSCVLVIPQHNCILLITNNGSLYAGSKLGGVTFFASERYHLEIIDCKAIHKVKGIIRVNINSPQNAKIKQEILFTPRRRNLLPEYVNNPAQEKMLVYEKPELRRCTRCILPETMPFIEFDDDGVCNYCHGYRPKNTPKPIEQLKQLVQPYKRKSQDCIVPFSGGRDSSFALHMIVNELGMKPVAYTYDWGMVTDLGRRNISRMCAALGVENIIVAADIHRKRDNIRRNLEAWLRRPHLGMVPLLMAGDKHFYKYVEQVKQQTGISLNIWGVNPMEMTHFKAGFLGVPPAFDVKYIYSQSAMRQMRYQVGRISQMIQNTGYINRSLWDTVTGEYWRSYHRKTDYFHFYDYYRWDEAEIDKTLDAYNWERSPDTETTWRIGDGTAALYNYIYYTVAGFSEHDTFRSNQIREGQLTRAEALRLSQRDNRPRFQTIRWYLDAVGVDYERAMKIINDIPKLYEL